MMLMLHTMLMLKLIIILMLMMMTLADMASKIILSVISRWGTSYVPQNNLPTKFHIQSHKTSKLSSQSQIQTSQRRDRASECGSLSVLGSRHLANFTLFFESNIFWQLCGGQIFRWLANFALPRQHFEHIQTSENCLTSFFFYKILS